MKSSRRRPLAPRHRPPLELSLALAVVAVLLALPPALVLPPKSLYQRFAGPQQRAVAELVDRGAATVSGVRQVLIGGASIAQYEIRVHKLEVENRRLLDQVAVLRATGATAGLELVREPSPLAGEGRVRGEFSDGLLFHGASETVGYSSLATPTEPLVATTLVEARVLARQARVFLARRELLDRGSRDALERDALVLDPSALLDVGADAGLAVGQVVLAGRRVCGKLTEVGPWTSTFCRIDETGYRDVVEIVRANHESATPAAARGIWEGTGGKLCRVRQVDASEPVSPGDLVVAAAGNVGSERLLYGRVRRVAEAPGGTHWDIWAEPASDRRESLARVVVIGRELNPVRLAKRSAGTSAK